MFEPYLKNRCIINLYLKPVEPLHIGEQSEVATKRVIRVKVNKKHTFIIPSESIKGTLRKLATVIAKSMQFSNIEVTEIVKGHKKDNHTDYIKQHTYSEEKVRTFLKKLFTEEQLNELTENVQYEYYTSLLCPICNLFGGKGVSSIIKFFDILPISIVGKNKTSLSYKTYTSTSIDRNLGTAKKYYLHEIEYVEPSEDLRFELKLILNNIETGSDISKLFANLMQYLLNEGITLGGLKSKGFGKLKIDEEKSNVKIIKLETEIKTNEEIKSNILKIALKEGVEQCTVEEFIRWLKAIE